MKYNQDKVKYIVDSYLKEGKTGQQIAEELGTYNTTIRRILIRNGITLRTNKEIQSLVKHNPFIHDSGYWVGLLAADGCITGNRVVLELIDRELLEQYKAFLNSPVNINISYPNKGKPLYRVAFKNDEIVRYLASLGITPNKSFSLELKVGLNYNMLRGIIDGDGHIKTMNKGNNTAINIFGKATTFLNQIESFLVSEGFNPTRYQDKRGLMSVNLYKQEELSKLFHLLYDDAEYFLYRKYSKIGSLLGKLNSIDTTKTGKP